MAGHSVGIANRIAAKKSALSRASNEFSTQPEPRTIGNAARGRQILSGTCLFAGELAEIGEGSIWDVAPPSAEFLGSVHGFAWIDHLAALGSQAARNKAKTWVWDWIARYGSGSGPAWVPQLAGRRAIRLISNGVLLLRSEEQVQQQVYFKSLSVHAGFLRRRAKTAPLGLARIEALSGLVFCCLAFDRWRKELEAASEALAKTCDQVIGPDGEIPSRNPEELVKMFETLAWASAAMGEAGLTPKRGHLLALERIVPCLRAMRLGDGGMVHMGNGGRGISGRLDQSLADAAIKLPAREHGAMGYARLSAGRSQLIFDTGPQEMSPDAQMALHSFEFSNGCHPIIVNSGPGSEFGGDWIAQAKTIAFQSSLAVNGQGFKTHRNTTHLVATTERARNLEFEMLASSHSGFEQEFGLRHFRSIELHRDGDLLRGKDVLVAKDNASQKLFDRWLKRNSKRMIPFELRFHIHPDITVELGLKDSAAVFTLPDGQTWLFKAGGHKLAIKPSVFMEVGRLQPRKTNQVLVNLKAIKYESTGNWTLERVTNP